MQSQTDDIADNNDPAWALDQTAVEAIWSAVERSDQSALLDLLEPMHPADIADIVEQADADDRAALLSLWGKELDGDVLSELDENLRADVVEELPTEVIAEAISDLESDDVVDLIEDLDEPMQERVLDALDDADRVAVEQSLTYPEDSAGRLMQRELVMAPMHWTVGQAIDYLRGETDLPDRFYDVVIVDPRLQPIGKVPLFAVMSNPRDVALSTIMDQNFHIIPAAQPEEDVAYAFNQYHIISAPVVDDTGRLVGVITIDDAMEVLDEEAEEDLRRLAGLGDESLTDSAIETAKQRFPWLAVNLVTAIAASIVIAQFSGVIEAIVALAVLMPIVASMGGNAATQTMTVGVRALATKDLTSQNAWRVVRREVLVGLMNGLVFAVILGAVGMIWYGTPMLGVVLAAAMVVNLLMAGLAGILIPIALQKFGVDPALASGAFVTTVTDVVGFFAFLGLAALWLL
ncbi:MAG: magnesium transporter [Pseudomonadota bacterium]